MPSYFLPPIEPNLSVVRGTFAVRRFGRVTPKFRQLFFSTRRGRDIHIEPSGTVVAEPTATSTTYLGGRWNGPLTSAQITQITNAGHATRIYTVSAGLEGTLPAWIDG